MNQIDELSYKVIGCAMEVHKTLGPGLFENIYEQALVHELTLNGIPVKTQVEIEINYKGTNLGNGLRLDVLVDNTLIVELKSVEELKPLHHKQLLTYLRLTDKRVGILINFNTENLKDGIKRIVNKY
ncbi:MAG: GxxExxY protein [Bacteroidaceae bacterium]|nr:GxxExxY protein [Bacteroidaceae bacterium]